MRLCLLPILGCSCAGKSRGAPGGCGRGASAPNPGREEQRGHPRLLVFKVFPDLPLLVGLSRQRAVVLEMPPLPPVGLVLSSR